MKEFICPELRDRVDFHITRFREAHDQKGRGWVTIDGQEIIDCSFYRWQAARYEERDQLLKKLSAKPSHQEYLEIDQVARETVEAIQIFDDRYFRDSLVAYLDFSHQDALASNNPIIKAFAVIDRRLGKRTFEKIHLTADEFSLVRNFYQLRSNEFGIDPVLQN